MSFKENGGAIIADVLDSERVRSLFTLCGGHISPILVEAKRRGIRVVDMRDEKNAVFAADATARITGTVGIAAVTAGPGVTNAVTALKNAQMAQSPLVMFAGATATLLKGRGSLQDIDQLALVSSCTKWARSVRTLSALGPSVRKAFDIARSGVPGPVVLEVPVDLLYSEEIIRDMFAKELGGGGKAGSLADRAVRLFVKGYLYRQFNAPHFELPIPTEVALPHLRSNADKVAQAAAVLEKAERPVLVVGSQAMVGRAPEALASAVQALGVPTFLAGMARGLLGRKSDIQFRHARGPALKEADAVIVLGMPFDFRLKYGRAISRKATLIAANLSAAELRKNRRPQIAAEMHAAEFLELLVEQVPGRAPRWQPWLAACGEREVARDREIEQMAKQRETGGVSPLDLLLKIEAKMAEDAVIVVDGGDFAASAAYTLRPRGALRWLDPGVFGTLGVGGGFAVGAQVAYPSSQVWLMYGDGSSAYSLAEFDTCKRHGLAPIAVVGTDALWAQIAREQTDMLGDDVGTRLLKTDYQAVAEGYGGKGFLVTEPEQVDAALDGAIAASKQGIPSCINVHLAATDFRKGSMSM